MIQREVAMIPPVIFPYQDSYSSSNPEFLKYIGNLISLNGDQLIKVLPLDWFFNCNNPMNLFWTSGETELFKKIVDCYGTERIANIALIFRKTEQECLMKWDSIKICDHTSSQQVSQNDEQRLTNNSQGLDRTDPVETHQYQFPALDNFHQSSSINLPLPPPIYINSKIEGGIKPRKTKKTKNKLRKTIQRRRAWEKKEDKLLIELVNKFGTESWVRIAERFPKDNPRNNKQCRERWYFHLEPKLSKKPLDFLEKVRLLKIYEEEKIRNVKKCHLWRNVTAEFNRILPVGIEYSKLHLYNTYLIASKKIPLSDIPVDENLSEKEQITSKTTTSSEIDFFL